MIETFLTSKTDLADDCLEKFNIDLVSNDASDAFSDFILLYLVGRCLICSIYGLTPLLTYKGE
jgi:hypothetical protein